MLEGMQLKIHITWGSGMYVYHTHLMLKTKIFRPGSVLQEFILFHPLLTGALFFCGVGKDCLIRDRGVRKEWVDHIGYKTSCLLKE